MKTKFFYGMAALATLGLTACSSEDLGTYDPGKAEADQTQFVTIQICSPKDATRADYEHGVANESNVESLDFIFYDVNGNPTAERQRFTRNATSGNWEDGEWNDASNDTEYEDNGNVTRIWTNVVPVQLTQGQNLPAQVVCLVNTTEARAVEIANKTLDQLRDETASIFSRGDKQFLMTNSVYFGTNVLTGEPNQRLCATPINAAQLFPTREKAKEELDKLKGENANPDDPNALFVNIYVERLAAKVGLTMASTAIKPYNLVDGNGDAVALNFVPEYWFVNATSNNGYITKRYGISESKTVTETDDDGNVTTKVVTTINMKPTYGQINDAFTNTGMAGGEAATGWNYAANHRSFWACSPSYYATLYPMVSDQVDDLEDATTEEKYEEKYYTYNEIKNSTAKGVESIAIKYNNGFTTGIAVDGEDNATGATTGFIYTRETTASIGQINGHKNPAAVVASAVVVGHYQVGTETDQHDFYVDRNNGNNGVYYKDLASAKAVLAARQGAIFKAVTVGDGANQTTTYEALTKDEIIGVYNNNFTVEHPKAAVRALLANPYLAGRLVTLQMTSLPTEALYIFDVITSKYVPITADNLSTANKNLCGAGYLDMFKNGIAFYSVPIRHLGFGVNVDSSKPLYTGEAGKPIKYNWENMRLGDLGVVRNHVYNLTITSIGQGLGTGVRDENQPIVPPVDVTESYIAMRLNILAWNIANSWSVDL